MLKNKIINTLTHLIPLSIRKKIYVYYKNKFEANRLSKERTIPKVTLLAQHIANCKIVLNREDLIERLPKNGTVAEVGVDIGDFSEQIFLKSNPKVLHLIDLWDFKYYGNDKYEFVCNRFKELLKKERVVVHKKLSIDAVDDFPDKYFDWIYIDTDHTYKTTRDELIAYAAKIKPSGFIAGHDYTKGDFVKAIRVGVIEAVHEFCVENDWELAYLTIDPIEIQSFAIRRKDYVNQS
jgi:hypothetical protein